jgi:Kef-type K+ transport system membrane component KefB
MTGSQIPGTKESMNKETWNMRKVGAFNIAIFVVAMDAAALVASLFTDLTFGVACGLVGFITLFGTLAAANHLSQDTELGKKEIRTALTIAFTTVYLVLVSFVAAGGLSGQSAVEESAIGHLTWVEGIVVVFYFGSRFLEKYMDVRAEEKEAQLKHEEEMRKLEQAGSGN